LSHLRQIAAGDGFSSALRADGTVLAWGRNEHGQLGNGTQQDSAKPCPIPGLRHILTLNSGYEHTVALDQKGSLWSWGDNNLCQLGNTAPSYSLVPMPVVMPSDMHPRGPWQVAVGGYHAMICAPGGPILGFGCNQQNQLGDWSWENKRIPVSPNRNIR
jgi:alpha-tubulin suppressor-like RCC1 family protein